MSAFRRPFQQGLHGLRGIAAFSVLFSHLVGFIDADSPVLEPLHAVDGGQPSVALFFVLSGTVIGISLDGFSLASSSYLRYLARRAFRLLPLIITTSTMIFFLLPHIAVHRDSPLLTDFYRASYRGEFPSWRLLRSWIGYDVWLDPPLWSLFVEIIASILLPFFFVIARRATGAVALSAGLLALSLSLHVTDDDPVFRSQWPVFLFNFSMGLLACHAADRYGSAVARAPAWLRLSTVIALYLLLMKARGIIGYDAAQGATSNVVETLISFTIVTIMLAAPLRNAPPPRLFRTLGDLSYGVYLTHYFVVFVIVGFGVSFIGPRTTAHAQEIVFATILAASCCVTLLVAYLAHAVVERPMIEIGRSVLRRYPQMRSTAAQTERAD
jgi:peptidoglycan/LPS O-acetylase OafA/YrhL